MRIDAHQHFWRYRAADYPWIDDTMAALRRDFLPEDLQPELTRHDIAGTIAVQACQTVAETEWLLQLADAHSFIVGVIGWIDLRKDDAEREIDRMLGHGKLVGIRHVLQSEPDDRFMLRKDFCRGVAALGRFGLPYDILIYPRHLPVAAEFVAKFGDQTFVLDHLAKPEIRAGAIDDWTRDLSRLAGAPNVWCKVSGLVTEADWTKWKPGHMRPYLDVAFDCFGAERLIAGSDWPVCTVAADYSRTMAVVTDYLAGRTPSERDAVLGGNAQRVWRRGSFAVAEAQERSR